jgi:hypothetical protein
MTSSLVLQIVLCALLSCAACERPMLLDPGEDAFAILPESVMTFNYETAEFYVSAHRFAERDPFLVVVETRLDGGLVHCASDENFNLLLRDFESLKIRRRLDEKQLAKLSAGRAYHRLRFASAPPTEAYDAVLTPLSNGFLTIQLEGSVYELSLSRRAVDQLGHSCRSAHGGVESTREAPGSPPGASP